MNVDQAALSRLDHDGLPKGPWTLLPYDGIDLERRESWLAFQCTRAEWERLPAYDLSVPTGVVVGKHWRRTDDDGEWVAIMALPLWGDGPPQIVFRPFVEV